MKNQIICIGRQYGSGGREIGERLAKNLNITCYDKLLLSQSAQMSQIPLITIESQDEKPVEVGAMLSGNVFADSAAMGETFYSPQEKVFEAQRKAILALAQKESCVIIGRCAPSILRNTDANVLSVFVYADDNDRIRRIAERNQIDDRSAERKMRKVDRMRKKYFDFYSDTLWGDPASYDIMISSSKYGIDGTANILQEIVNGAAKRKGDSNE